MNKKVDILELNDGDELVFLNYLNEKYLIFYIGGKDLYIPFRNNLLVDLCRTICITNESLRGNYQIRIHALVLLNGKLSIVKYGQTLSDIVRDNDNKLFGTHFPSILKISVGEVNGKWKSYVGSRVLDTNIDITLFHDYGHIFLFNQIYRMLNIYDKDIKKKLLMNNFGFFLKELKKIDSENIEVILNNKVYTSIFREYKLKCLGFDE
jgi:hypothetical protein